MAFTVQQLWRQALWSSAAAAALLIAIVSSRNDVDVQKAMMVQTETQSIGKTGSLAPSRSFETDAATRQLAQTVRGLTEDLSHIMTRLATVEHNIDELSSATQQIDANKNVLGQSPPAWAIEASSTSAAFAPDAPSGERPADGMAIAPSPNPLTPGAGDLPADTAATASTPAYGAEIGSASSIKALLARWAQIRAAHAQAFEGLKPVLTLKDNPRSNRVELRLVVGSFANAGRAAKLCASLTALRISCQPTMLDGQQLALQ